ncbi:DUF4232 domain-containing protein [Streptomyces sp. ISL-36]|uniref:DUF4232 domain-containing protein n=1 Tax=Streptomyces sp. ISL-36 TaxID=2819182 RepID=UPI001BE7BEA6|nr:DUF4232 domain-containing protein [Streptomyces sp. ISL-36]MBT2439554.1 DUF4232 domain-containing protein [Streptomyces sp. ISL-36]
MTVLPVRHALVVAVVAVLTAGCGLAAELDREVDPERTGAAATPNPPRTGAPAEARTPRPGEDGPTPSVAATGCPATGVKVSTGAVNAAMGLRAMPVTLTNCTDITRQLNGYPDVRVRDARHEPMDVTVLRGPEPITRLDDPGPHPVTLRPGESARSVFVWRYSTVDPATGRGSGVYVEIAPAAGTERQTVVPEGGLDVGETGLLGTTAWQKVVD